MNLINVVAPVFNEEDVIEEFTQKLANTLNGMTTEYKILLIDDGSVDTTWAKIVRLCQVNKKIAGIRLSRNFGHHHAITAGIYHTKSEWVVVMDSDLQDRPEVIPELLKKAEEGFDVVFASRIERPESIWYLILQKIFYFLLNLLSGIKFESRQANFSIINRKVVEAFKNFPEQARFYGSTVQWLGFRRSFVEVKHGKRFSGKPSYTISKRFKLASDIILAFSDRPLKFATYLGLFMSFISLIIICWILLKLGGQSLFVFGWASVIACIFLIGGIIIFILGIIGIYLSKIFNEVKHRPLFVIDSKINCAPEGT